MVRGVSGQNEIHSETPSWKREGPGTGKTAASSLVLARAKWRAQSHRAHRGSERSPRKDSERQISRARTQLPDKGQDWAEKHLSGDRF